MAIILSIQKEIESHLLARDIDRSSFGRELGRSRMIKVICDICKEVYEELAT